jgi:hypothetical protein
LALTRGCSTEHARLQKDFDIMNPKQQISERLGRRFAACSAVKHHRGDVKRATRASGFSPRFIRSQLKKQLTQGTLIDKPRSGRPGVLNAAQIEAACTLVAEEQSVPKAAAILREQGIIDSSTHTRTVQRAVKKHMELVSVNQQPLLSQQTKKRRLAFCKQQHDPDTLVAVDSTYLTLSAQWRRRKMWVRKGTKPVVSKPNKSQQLHVSAGITKYGVTQLIRVTGTTGHPLKYYRYDSKLKANVQMTGVGSEEFQYMLKNELNPAVGQIFAVAGQANYTYLLDGAPAHTAKASKAFLRDNSIDVLPGWPPNSPDLNPIENAWAWLKLALYAKQHNSLDEMWEHAQRIWNSMPLSMCENLMDSIATRKAICVEQQGGHTGY